MLTISKSSGRVNLTMYRTIYIYTHGKLLLDYSAVEMVLIQIMLHNNKVMHFCRMLFDS